MILFFPESSPYSLCGTSSHTRGGPHWRPYEVVKPYISRPYLDWLDIVSQRNLGQSALQQMGSEKTSWAAK